VLPLELLPPQEIADPATNDINTQEKMARSLDFASLRRLPSLAGPVNGRGWAAITETKAGVLIDHSSSKSETRCYSLQARLTTLPHPGCLPRSAEHRRNKLSRNLFSYPVRRLGYNHITQEQPVHREKNQAALCEPMPERLAPHVPKLRFCFGSATRRRRHLLLPLEGNGMAVRQTGRRHRNVIRGCCD
jgi:hypothetical protein